MRKLLLLAILLLNSTTLFANTKSCENKAISVSLQEEISVQADQLQAELSHAKFSADAILEKSIKQNSKSTLEVYTVNVYMIDKDEKSSWAQYTVVVAALSDRSCKVTVEPTLIQN